MAKKQTPLDALNRAIEIAGSQQELARRVSSLSPEPIGQPAISNWVKRLQRVPAERVIAVEKAVEGAVKRHELRPDIYPAGEGRAA